MRRKISDNQKDIEEIKKQNIILDQQSKNYFHFGIDLQKSIIYLFILQFEHWNVQTATMPLPNS